MSYSPAEIMENYTEIGKKKAEGSAPRMFALALAAGMVIGFAAFAASVASYAVENPSIARVISGLLFPFGLGIVMLLGMELFTGNCMAFISIWSEKARVFGVLRNLAVVYVGNMLGSVPLAAVVAFSGQMGRNDGALAVYAIRAAAAKCQLDAHSAVILGFLCNILVCLGVLCAMSAKDTIGCVAGAYIPVALFVIGGFEHSVANMYSIPAGIFAMIRHPDIVAAYGLDVSALSWRNFFIVNLLPVTIGNILGGAGIATLLWACHCHRNERKDIYVLKSE
ncbi:MAG: formate/nitrite transporter family protein [Clostridiales bacterium]|jgi:formate/nitrite transporter|nr:formate/nitrite transporter family protein [Clostridiales bacterium]